MKRPTCRTLLLTALALSFGACGMTKSVSLSNVTATRGADDRVTVVATLISNGHIPWDDTRSGEAPPQFCVTATWSAPAPSDAGVGLDAGPSERGRRTVVRQMPASCFSQGRRWTASRSAARASASSPSASRRPARFQRQRAARRCSTCPSRAASRWAGRPSEVGSASALERSGAGMTNGCESGARFLVPRRRQPRRSAGPAWPHQLRLLERWRRVP